MSPRFGLVAAVVAGFLSVALQAGEDVATKPYTLVVDAAFGRTLGPEAVRDELERELSERLAVDGCFQRVLRSNAELVAEADLVAEVILDGFEEDTRYDVTVETHNRPGEPGSDLKWSAHVETFVQLQVRRAADRAVVKMKRKRESVTRRAQPAEDTRHEARATLIEKIVREAYSYLCKGTPQKWEKRIRQARPVGGSD